MSEKRIVGVDVGTYSVKVVYLDPASGDLTLLGFDRERVLPVAKPDAGSQAAATPPLPGAPPPTPGSEAFDEEPTNVREAPGPGDADETLEATDEPLLEGAAAVDESSELDEAPDWARALARLADRDALSGQLQAAAVPGNYAILVELEVPFQDRSKVENILPHLLADKIPLSANEVVWDFQTYPKFDVDAEGARALIGYARNKGIQDVLDGFEYGGVDPATLGLPELQLASAGVRILGGPQPDPIAFVDLGHETTHVAIVDGWNPLLGRTIRSGGKQLTESVAEAFGGGTFEEAERTKHQHGAIYAEGGAPNPDIDRLSESLKGGLRPVVRELRRTFQGLYARKRVEVTKVYLCGGTSLLKNVDGYLEGELGVPVVRLPATVPGLMDPYDAATNCVAIGAALAQQDDGIKARTINLRKGTFAYRGKSSYLRRQMFIAAAAIFGLMMALGVTLYVQKLSYEAQRDAMKTALAKQTKALFGTELTSKAQIQKVMAGEEGGSNTFIPKKTAYQLLHDLTQTVSKDVEFNLDRIEVDTDRNLIQIYGETTDAQAVDKIVSDLEKIECLKEIKKDKLRVRDEKADFELQISSGCS